MGSECRCMLLCQSWVVSAVGVHSAGFLSNADDTTVRELIQVLRQTKTQFRPLPGFENNTVDVQDRLNAGVDCDEVIGKEDHESIARCRKVGRGKPVSLLLDAARWEGEGKPLMEEGWLDIPWVYAAGSLESDGQG
uniref:Uncharacterized protein n=1 Tax=Timema monikensis TaxID=170555 RepID=A0A7R9E9J5_9NEOP|nr:unnamed protein product [Timema monikensis]